VRTSNSDALAWLRKRRWRIGVALVAVVAGGYFGYLQLAGPKVEAARVVRRDVVQSVVAAGRVAAPNRIDIGVQIVGTVARVPVAEGQVVKAGQPLIVLDASELSAAVAQAQVTLTNATAQLERNRRLKAQGFLGAAALDDVQRNYDVARTQLDAARAKLAYTLIKAPAGGTLIARDVERGELVQPGKVLMVLSPAGATQIVLQIDERNLARLKLGQRALASADAYPEERFAAEVAYINPGVDAQRGTVEVKLAVPQPPEYLRQDMTVSADIETGRHVQTLALAADAVHDAAGAAPWVLAVRNGRTVRQRVNLGLRGDAVVEILDGLAEGELAVRAGNATIRAAQPVRPVVHE
jgi:HlyD family secretion protein